jgi:hypothetical protein
MKTNHLKYLTSTFLIFAVMPLGNSVAQELSNDVFFIKSFSYHLIRDIDDPEKVGVTCTSTRVDRALIALDKEKEFNCKIKIDVLKEMKEQASAWNELSQALNILSKERLRLTPMKVTAEKVVNGLAVTLRLQNSLTRQEYFRSQSDCESTLKEYYKQINLPRCKFEPKALEWLDGVP